MNTSERPKHTREEYGLKEGAEDFPLMVVLSFVYTCNARCPNCPYNNSDIRKEYKDAPYMPDDVFKKIADECSRFGSYIRISGGGEPMLHPHAIELILYAKEKGAKIGLITNGSNFTDHKLTLLLKHNIDAIEFSVDAGDPITYETVRPGLDWQRLTRSVLSAVRLRGQYNAKTRIIASVINQKGVDVKAAQEYWEKIVDNVQIRKFLTWGYNQDQSADSSVYLPPDERIPCPWLFERLNIDSRGAVTLCGEDIAFKHAFANITNQSIQSIWTGPKMNRFRELHLNRKGHEIPICRECPDWCYRSWNYNYWKVLRDAGKTGHKR